MTNQPLFFSMIRDVEYYTDRVKEDVMIRDMISSCSTRTDTIPKFDILECNYSKCTFGTYPSVEDLFNCNVGPSIPIPDIRSIYPPSFPDGFAKAFESIKQTANKKDLPVNWGKLC